MTIFGCKLNQENLASKVSRRQSKPRPLQDFPTHTSAGFVFDDYSDLED